MRADDIAHTDGDWHGNGYGYSYGYTHSYSYVDCDGNTYYKT